MYTPPTNGSLNNGERLMRPLSSHRRCRAAVASLLSSLRFFTLSEDQADVAGAVRLLSTLKYRFLSSSGKSLETLNGDRAEVQQYTYRNRSRVSPALSQTFAEGITGRDSLARFAVAQAAEPKTVRVEGGHGNSQPASTPASKQTNQEMLDASHGISALRGLTKIIKCAHSDELSLGAFEVTWA